MTDRNTEESAALYVLGLLRGTDLREFEMQLADSPELRKQVRELSSGLHAPVRRLQGPERMDILEKIHASLGDVSETGKAADLPTSASQPSRPWSLIWGIAASILLILNLVLMAKLARPGEEEVPVGAAVSQVSNSSVHADPVTAVDGPGQTPEILEARIEGLVSDVLKRDSWLEKIWEDKQQLLRENQEVKSYNQDWQREYARLAARVLPFFDSNGRLSRFTVIELVDSGSLGQADAGFGFADLAGQFLTGEATIAQGDSIGFVGPTLEGDPALASVSASSSLAAVARDSMGQSLQSGENSLAATAAPPHHTDRAAGFTVWRDDEQKGFLDLYNLPVVDEGQPYLWVRSSELEPYVPVGQIPVTEDGNGSFFYSVEEPDFTPTEILITAEPEGNPVTQPTGTVLLKGP